MTALAALTCGFIRAVLGDRDDWNPVEAHDRAKRGNFENRDEKMKCEQCKRDNGIRKRCPKCGRQTCSDCWSHKHNSDVCQNCEPTGPTVTHEVAGRVYEALRAMLRAHLEDYNELKGSNSLDVPVQMMNLYTTVEEEMPELLAD